MRNDPAPNNRALEESGQRLAEQQRMTPVARWPFRIFGGLIAALCLLMLGLQVRSLIRGELSVTDIAALDLGMLVLVGVMALGFGFTALTGQIPDRVWKLMIRTMGPGG